MNRAMIANMRLPSFARRLLAARCCRLGLAGAGAGALLLVGALAAAPAGAKTEFVLGAGGAGMTIKPAVAVTGAVTIKAGPVTFTGNAGPARMPQYVSTVGHFVVGGYGARRPLAVPVGGTVYLCPPFAPPTRNLYGYAGTPVYGAAGYGVPAYDYRAAGSTRARSAYFQALELNRRAQARAARPDTPGTFNQPPSYSGGRYTAVPDTTLRPVFAPLVVQIAGKAQAGGKLPLVHKPAGKRFIRVE